MKKKRNEIMKKCSESVFLSFQTLERQAESRFREHNECRSEGQSV